MSNKFILPRGTSDILPSDIPIWNYIEKESKNILNIYNYKEIRTPIFEEMDLFARSMGQTSDVVQKQMLNLASQRKDDDGNLRLSGLSLRPENTASVVRSYIQNRFDKKESLSKLFYIGPMFRGERPQKGRLRQFNQIGVESIGPDSCSPYLDAEVIALSVNMLKSLGVKDFCLKINTLGSPQDKENFSVMLRDLINPVIEKLCPDCQDRFERNVFRILDCKVKSCKDVVSGLNIDYSYLSDDSKDYFDKVKEILRSLNIEFQESIDLVRGLDYYCHTVFEISCPSLGSQDALGAGGRYNNLVSQLGGPEVDAVGFALGIERIILALSDKVVEDVDELDVFIAALDEKYLDNAFKLLFDLRSAGIAAEMSSRVSSMKSLMRMANKLDAKRVVIIGEEEVNKGVVTVKDMATGEQKEVVPGELILES